MRALSALGDLAGGGDLTDRAILLFYYAVFYTNTHIYTCTLTLDRYRDINSRLGRAILRDSCRLTMSNDYYMVMMLSVSIEWLSMFRMAFHEFIGIVSTAITTDCTFSYSECVYTHIHSRSEASPFYSP